MLLGPRLRLLKPAEENKRGCEHCADSPKRHWCPHEICPYTQLDDFKSYSAYIKSTGGVGAQIVKRLREW